MTFTKSLTPWQKKQATLLYYFASDEYLKGLHTQVRELQSFVDQLLDKSRHEGRDRYLISSQWGERDTTENWSNHGWSFLADFGLSVARDIADRASNIYHVTGAYQCGRGMSEYSMQWTLPAEQEQFDAMFEAISHYAGYIDRTMDKSHRNGRWSDFIFTRAWEKHKPQFFKLPKFRIMEDISCQTGAVPPKSGVYMSLDYPDAVLQFAWNGNEYGKLRECSIFNDLGCKAFASVGRSKLWVDKAAMLAFVQANAAAPELKEDSFDGEDFTLELAPSLVARNAFTSVPSRWCYVELVEGEFEQVDTEPDQLTFTQRRFESGEICEIGGFYFTPASPDSRRHFQAGAAFPGLDSVYGKTIWQWDDNQG